MTEPSLSLPHRLTLDQRNKLQLTGAREVIHFDEELVELDTSLGTLVVQGTDLRLKCLALEDGTVVIQGTIQSLSYDAPQKRRGLFR